MEPKRLQQYAKLCKKLGITKLTVGDVSFEIDLAFEPPSKQSAKAAEQFVPAADPIVDEMDEESLLYWSSSPALDNN